ncbi:MAG: M60 family metallopeptidase [Odoribacteraceae bacterium]|jgi:hypothetical protein|nr:M60 family metallopeptidase [Odoribacteraceae bacterium]
MKNIFYLLLFILFSNCSGDDLPDGTTNLPPRPGTFNPVTIFTDVSCTELREGMTKAFIDSVCDNAMYRSIALQMLDGTYASEFRVARVEPLPEPSVDASINKTAKYGVMDYPTGISLKSGDTLHVFVSGLQNPGEATLKIQTLTTATTGGYSSGPAAIPLSNGENIIVPGILPGSGNGLAYIRYYYTSATRPPDIKLNIHGGEVNGCFDLRKHTNDDWQRLISAAVNPYFDLVGKYATVTAPTDWFRQYTGGRGKDLIDAYDAVVYLEWKFMGLLDPPNGFGGKHRTRAYFHHEVMNTGVGAYASDYHTAYPGNYMANPDAIVGANVWVFGHEHGHVNQTRPAFRWGGMVEVTNNIEALYLLTHARELVPSSPHTNLRTNLQTVTDGGYVNTYERAFNWFFGKDRPNSTPTPHNLNEDNAHLFHQLVPFWQIYLYLDNVLGKTGTHGASFYEDIYEHYRKQDPYASSRTDGQHQIYFVELVCRLANLDLTDFFKKTGFLQPYGSGTRLVSEAMIETAINNIKGYPPLTQAMEYITDANVHVFRDKLPLQTGYTAEVRNNVFVSPPEGWTNAVAFEARAGGPTGDLRRVYTAGNAVTAQPFSGNGFLYDIDVHRLYAVGHDGERREVPVTLAGTTPTPDNFTIGTGHKVLYLIPELSTSDTWTIDLSTTWTAEEHVNSWGSALLASDEDPGKDGGLQKFQYYWNAPTNKNGVISFNNTATSFPRPTALPVTFTFKLECAGDGDIYITFSANGSTIDARRKISGMTALEHISKNTIFEMQGSITR